jgi:hypothetical protein
MIKRLLSYMRLLSLDVVLGACVSTLFVAKNLGVDLPGMVVVALAIAVWSIYTIDHLLDGNRSKVAPLTDRHQFHLAYRQGLLIVLGMMLIFGVVVVFQLPSTIIFNGLILVGCVIAYFIGLKIIGAKPSAYKEPLVAIAYAVGVFLGPVSLLPVMDYTSVLLLFAIYLMLAFCNLLIFSIYELQIDEQAQHTSLVRYTGKRTAHLILFICFVLLCLLISYQLILVGNPNLVSITFVMMTGSLIAINYFQRLFTKNEWYRILGDGIFYFPLIVII